MCEWLCILSHIVCIFSLSDDNTGGQPKMLPYTERQTHKYLKTVLEKSKPLGKSCLNHCCVMLSFVTSLKISNVLSQQYTNPLSLH